MVRIASIHRDFKLILTALAVEHVNILESVLQSTDIRMGVEDWTWIAKKHSMKQPQRLQRCKISSVQHWKSTGLFGHEYLLLTMLDLIPNDNQPPQLYTRFIKIERGVKRSNYLASFTASLLTSGGEADPLDIITISPTAFSTEGSYLLNTLEFEETLPTVAHLAAVLKAVHVKAPKYTLYSSMCYWFAGAAFEGLGYLCTGMY